VSSLIQVQQFYLYYMLSLFNLSILLGWYCVLRNAFIHWFQINSYNFNEERPKAFIQIISELKFNHALNNLYKVMRILMKKIIFTCSLNISVTLVIKSYCWLVRVGLLIASFNVELVSLNWR